MKRRGSYRVLVGRPDVKRRLERPGFQWEDNMKLKLSGIGKYGLDFVLEQDSYRWRQLVEAARNCGFRSVTGISPLAEEM